MTPRFRRWLDFDSVGGSHPRRRRRRFGRRRLQNKFWARIKSEGRKDQTLGESLRLPVSWEGR